MTDPEGNCFQYSYLGQTDLLTKIVYPTVNTIQGPSQTSLNIAYDIYGRIIEHVGGDGLLTRYQYYDNEEVKSSCGKLWKVIRDPDGLAAKTEYTYSLFGKIDSITDEQGDTKKYTYNELEQIVEEENALNQVTSYSYSDYGYVKKKTIHTSSSLAQVFQYNYSPAGGLISTINPLGDISAYSYNEVLLPATKTDAENNITTTSYNERGLPIKVIDSHGEEESYIYNTNGKVVSKTDSIGNTTTYSYDGLGRLSRSLYADGSYEEFTYSKNNQVLTRRTRAGDTFTYQYDALGRFTQKTTPEGSIAYLFDDKGYLVEVQDSRSVDDGGGNTQFTYDSLGQCTAITDPCTCQIGYTYDSSGRTTQLTYPVDVNLAVQYEYDALDRITAIKRGSDTLAQYTYDDLNRRDAVLYGNGTTMSYTYDIGNRLTDLTSGLSGSQQLSYSYPSYDKMGNRLQLAIDGSDVYNYTYDNLYQLTNVVSDTEPNLILDYDSLGNRQFVTADQTLTTYVANQLNQYSSVNGQTYSYDQNGNLTDDGSLTYHYDSQNRLTQVRQGSTPQAYYAYDAAGRRHSKTIPGQDKIIYCYDDDSPANVLVEYQGSTWILAFIYGPRVDEPICMLEPDGDIYYYHYDGLGSVIALSDSNGNLVERYCFGAFGKPGQVSAIGNPYLFNGRRFDVESGLYNYRMRMYSPETGRFLSSDPYGMVPGSDLIPYDPLLQYHDGMNIYSYVKNNPINFVDPSGTCTIVWCMKSIKNMCVCMNTELFSPNQLAQRYIGKAGSKALKKLLKKLGGIRIPGKGKGSHEYYRMPNGKQIGPIPTSLSPGVAGQLLKQIWKFIC